MSNKSFFLIDAHALCYSSFYAIRELVNSKGQATNAVYGFVSTMKKILREYDPQYVGVCFDSQQKTLRQEKFANYKIQRQAMPDGLVSQIPLIKEVVAAMGLKIFEVGGYEADDLIGTLALAAVKHKGIEVVVVSEDKDMFQLAEAGVKFYSTRKDMVFGQERIKERFGFDARYIVDYLSLAGDSSDNIPGVRGIGEVTAKALIKEYGDLKTILKNAEHIKSEKLREKLVSQKKEAELSYELALLETQAPVDFNPKDLEIKPADNARLIELYKGLEFKKWLQELAGDEVPMVVSDLISIDDEASWGKFYKNVLKEKCFGFLVPDMTEDLDFSPQILVAVKAQVYSLKESHWAKLSELFLDKNITKVTHDLKAALKFLSKQEIDDTVNVFDVMLATFILGYQQASSNLQDIIWLMFKDASGKSLGEGMQASFLPQLYAKLIAELKEKSLLKLMDDIELPLSFVLYRMESYGVKIDEEHLKEMSAECGKRINALTKELITLAGEEFNLNSPKQLSHILFDVLKLPVIKKTKTGFSTDEEVLSTLALNNKFPALILEYRQLAKLKSTYIDALPQMIDSRTGRIHAEFDQIGAETGRLSSRNPNLQNIPIRTDLGRQIRKAFIPSEKNYTLISADYSQVELRILADLSKDKNLMKAFDEDQDIHNYTASLIFDLKDKEIDYHMRDTAKRINFGIVYGMSAYGLSKDLKISPNEAQDFIDKYFLRYPGVKKFMDDTIKSCEKSGYVTTILNRRRYIPGINDRNMAIRQFGQRQAINTPVQGSAADLMKLAMINVDKELQGKRARMLITVHDELVLEAHKDELSAVTKSLKKIMENAIEISVPIKVTVKTGTNWLEMKEVSS